VQICILKVYWLQIMQESQS